MQSGNWCADNPKVSDRVTDRTQLDGWNHREKLQLAPEPQKNKHFQSNTMSNSLSLVISELSGSKIRRTDDGRLSVYDIIRIAGGQKNPHQVWKRLTEAYSELLTKCESVKLGTGQAKKLTPVATSENALYILGLLPGVCGQAYREKAANIVRRYIEGDSDLGAELMLRDHNKDRQQKALKRVKVTLSNKDINALSHKHGLPYHKLHDDRNVGLYGKTTKQLRVEGDVERETPLNYLSDLDISYADAANGMVIAADNPALMALAAAGIADLHKRITGKKLEPVWDTERLTPAKARRITHSSNYQMELAV